MIFSGSSGKSPVMPIRRAAATPTQEKTPSAAAEKGKGEVVLHLHPVKPWPRRWLARPLPAISRICPIVQLQPIIHSLTQNEQNSSPDFFPAVFIRKIEYFRFLVYFIAVIHSHLYYIVTVSYIQFHIDLIVYWLVFYIKCFRISFVS